MVLYVYHYELEQGPEHLLVTHVVLLQTVCPGIISLSFSGCRTAFFSLSNSLSIIKSLLKILFTVKFLCDGLEIAIQMIKGREKKERERAILMTPLNLYCQPLHGVPRLLSIYLN